MHYPQSRGAGNDDHSENPHLEQSRVRQASTSSGQRSARGGVVSAENAQHMQNTGAGNNALRIPQRVEHAVAEPRQRGRHARVVSTPRNTDRVVASGIQTHTELGRKTLRANIMISTLNINGGGTLQTRDKWQHVDQLLRNKKVGILAVQETHLQDSAVDSLHTQFHQCLHIINS